MLRLNRTKKLLIPPLIFLSFISIFLVLCNNPLNKSGTNPEYEFPGKFLLHFLPNESYCNFKYGLPEELFYEENELKYSPELGMNSPYRVLYDIIEGDFSGLPPVTYTTHITADFVSYVAEIARFWEGPVSVSAFVPDADADATVTQLAKLCRCLPDMAKVSVHFVFPVNLPPYIQHSPQNYPNNCNLAATTKLSTFRVYNELIYPINVCRNVARFAAPTPHVLVSDIQLIPSTGLTSKFTQMLRKIRDDPSPKIYVVPVFEAAEDIPRDKAGLIHMVHQEKAVYFHRFVCLHCQKFPGVKHWLETDPGNAVKPFVTVKREYPFHRWEPVYIGTKNEPFYSEVLSWEGLQDKMTQMLEMCLIGYKFVILDGAFLVHWPGIKMRKMNQDNYWRVPFQHNNSRQYKRIVKDLLRKYKNNPRCKVQ